jgi:hypothetical protein
VIKKVRISGTGLFLPDVICVFTDFKKINFRFSPDFDGRVITAIF